MNTKQHIDSLFTGYEETTALIDFKEELQSNLNDRVQSLIKKGLDEKEAFDKAITELGDVSALAEEMSLKKRQEVYEEMYMKTRNYLTPKRSALYVLCGTLLGFGIVMSLVTWLASGEIAGGLGVLLPFGALPIAGFVFLGLTQETAVHEAMSWKRALWYVASCIVFLTGIFTFIVTLMYTEEGVNLYAALSVLIPFVLPSLALGLYLLLTEKDRSKPWVVEMRKKAKEREMDYFTSPAQEERFGLITGALWIAAIAGFVMLTITVGILYSWLTLVVALVAQLLILAAFRKNDKCDN